MQKQLLAASILLAAAGFAQAQNAALKAQPSNFNYNYLEVTYIDVDEPSVDGFKFKGSYDIAPNISVLASLALADNDNVDLTTITIGGAYHLALQGTELKQLDLVMHGEIERIKWEAGKYDDSDSGLLLGAELRAGITNEFELFGDATLRTTGDDDFLVTIGGRFNFNTQLQGVASYEMSDNDILSLGVRYHY